MAWHGGLYGLHIAADRAIPGLLPQSPAPPDVTVRLLAHALADLPGGDPGGEAAQAQRIACDPSEDVAYWHIDSPARGPLLRVDFGRSASVVVDQDARHVWCAWGPDSSLEEAAAYLCGPVLAHVTYTQGRLCLHASAVALGSRALALAGPSGAGKSMTAAAFADLGYPVLTEDVAALEVAGATLWVQPGPPRVNLWPDAAEGLFGPDHGLPAMLPDSATEDKRYLALGSDGAPGSFCARPLALGAVYVLGECDAALPDSQVEPVTGAAAVGALVSCVYPQLIYNARTLAADMAALAHIAETIPVRRLTRGADARAVRALCRAIAADFLALDRGD